MFARPCMSLSRIMATFVSLLLAVSLIPVPALAENAADRPALPVGGTCGGCSWSIDEAGNLAIAPAPGGDGVLGAGNPWLEFAGHVKAAVVGPGVRGDASGMFSNCGDMASADIRGLEATGARGMFSGCSSLASLDLSGFDTSAVTDMLAMFYHCPSLASVDVSSFDTSNVRYMNFMFSGCSSLASLDLSGFDTSGVDAIWDMFEGRSSLVSARVGSAFSFVTRSGSDRCTLPGGWWRSAADGRDYTASQIAADRGNVADAYTKVSAPSIIGISGDVVWKPSTEEPAVFRSSAPIAEFVEVRMDGKVVEPKNYDVREGSTIVEFKPDYLVSLPEGKHTIGIVSTYGIAEASITIEETDTATRPVQIGSITLSAMRYTYDGTEKRPTVTVTTNGKILMEGTDYDISYSSDVTNIGIKIVTVTGKGKYAGTLTASYEIIEAAAVPVDPKPDDPGVTDSEPVGTQAMYRLYNPNSGEHFYTASTIERDAVITAGWNDEGIGWTAPTEGIQVYRLYNSFAGEHHYTTSCEERDMLVSVGWTWEDGGWFSDPNESVPLYRAYNPNAFANNHHYTTDRGEFETLLSLGWQDEGVGWHGVG